MAGLRLLVPLCCLSLTVLCRQTAADVVLCSSFLNPETDGVGTAVSVSGVCYPNGSIVYSWSAQSSSVVRRVQIEYQCNTDARTKANPVIGLCWSNIIDGSQVVHDVWNGNMACTFSGCYETYFFTTHMIQRTNCTLPVTPPPPTRQVVTVSFRNATYQVPENNGSVFVCVTKNMIVEGSFSVEVTSIPQNAQGSLQPGSGDFLLVTRTATFTGNQQVACVSIPITDDSRHEPPEDFRVDLETADDVNKGAPNVAMVTIIDNDGADQELFQIQIGPVDRCISWNSKKTELLESNIRNTLVEVIVNQCKCKFPLSNIPALGQFSCRTTAALVTYRNTIFGTTGFNASQLLDILSNWVTSGPTIRIEKLLLDVCANCPVHISLLSDPECRVSESKVVGDPTFITSDPNVIQCVNGCLLKAQGRDICGQ